MRKLLRKILFLFYKPYGAWVISRDTTYKYGDIEVKVPKGVFHPGLFFSTKFLLSELKMLPLKDKTFSELGSGSGLISITMAKAGARVTAVDINLRAVAATAANAKANNVTIETLQSNLFVALQGRQFDIIAINPPYFKNNPTGNTSAAWDAGANYEYFQNLFAQIGKHVHQTTCVLMVVSEDVDIEALARLAAQNNIQLTSRRKKTISFEKNYIYQLLFQLIIR